MAQADQTRVQQNEQDTTQLLADQQKANRRLRIYAYFGITVLILGVITTVVLGLINTLALSTEQDSSKAARVDNHTLLERSVDGSVKANQLFNEALNALRAVGAANVQTVIRTELDLIAILKANGFTVPAGIPSH